jgi:hypothetical protein
MAYAHQGVELRPLPGLPPPQHAPTMTDTSFQGSEEPHAVLLTRKGTDALVHLEQLLDDADRALTAQGLPPGSFGSLDTGKDTGGNLPGAFATAADHGAAAASRGD